MMQRVLVFLLVFSIVPYVTLAENSTGSEVNSNNAKQEVTWRVGTDVEKFWLDYAESKGGLTWGKSSTYPEYAKVKEGDTLLIQLDQGLCLMEFFHSRWRRANDVRRWAESINDYGSCAHVFD